MSKPPQVRVNDPIKSRHNLAVTKATIKEILKDGTPDWFSHPEDYKNFAKEAIQYDEETSNDMVLSYKMGDQELLTNYKARAVNIMSTKSFVERLRENGIRCFALRHGLPQTVGLWCVVPTIKGIGLRAIAYMQVPAMIEWSVLGLDKHNLPAGELYRGWRTVACALVRKNILTEEKAHEIFGPPTDSIVSRRYRKTLWAHRHRKENVEVIDEVGMGK